MGEPPLLASMGKLERIVMAQTVASDLWKQARDAAKKEAAAAAAEVGTLVDAAAAPAAVGEAAEAAGAGTGALAAAQLAADNVDMDAGDEDMEGAGADAAADG